MYNMIKSQFDYLLITYNLDNYTPLGDIFNTVIIWVAAQLLQKFNASLVLNTCVWNSFTALKRSNMNFYIVIYKYFLKLNWALFILCTPEVSVSLWLFNCIIFWWNRALLRLDSPLNLAKPKIWTMEKKNMPDEPKYADTKDQILHEP